MRLMSAMTGMFRQRRQRRSDAAVEGTVVSETYLVVECAYMMIRNVLATSSSGRPGGVLE
jgi:hypothetical protein